MMRRRTMLGMAAAALVLFAVPAAADNDAGTACSPAEMTKAFADIARARANVTTLTGPFTQERTIGLLAAKVRSTGTLTLVRPDRLRWELAAPDDVIYWVTPEGLAYKSASGQGRAPAGTQRIAAALSDLRILLGGDLAGLENRYDVSGTCQGGKVLSFRAVPKPGASVSFQEMRFTLAQDLVAPESVTIVEGPRDRTEIHFGTMRANTPVAPGVMTP
jgi:hypothetical protein